MIVSFSVENFRSYKDNATLSFLALPKERKMHIFEDENIALYQVVPIFGANASGKSNLLIALRNFLTFYSALIKQDYTIENTIDSFGNSSKENIYVPYIPFDSDKPCKYEIELYNPESEYTYKYRLELDNKRIVSESLDAQKGKYDPKNYKPIFNRKLDEKTPNKISLVFDVEDPIVSDSFSEISNNTEFIKFINSSLHNFQSGLGLLTRAGSKYFKDIAELFNEVQVLFNINEISSTTFLGKQINDHISDKNGIHQTILKIVQVADPMITGIVVDEVSKNIEFLYGDKKNSYRIRQNDMSEGTRKILRLTPELLKVFWQGGVLCIDELDSHLHPFVISLLFENFFDNKDKHRQLIFSAHSISIIDFINRLPRQYISKNAIFFIKRDSEGASKIYKYSTISKNTSQRTPNFTKSVIDNRFFVLPHADKWFFHDFTEKTEEIKVSKDVESL